MGTPLPSPCDIGTHVDSHPADNSSSRPDINTQSRLTKTALLPAGNPQRLTEPHEICTQNGPHKQQIILHSHLPPLSLPLAMCTHSRFTDAELTPSPRPPHTNPGHFRTSPDPHRQQTVLTALTRPPAPRSPESHLPLPLSTSGCTFYGGRVLWAPRKAALGSGPSLEAGGFWPRSCPALPPITPASPV